MRRYYIQSIWLFYILIFGCKLLASEINDSLQLRVFPELQGKNISAISVINSNRAIAVAEEEIFKWDGTKWQTFNPAFPHSKIFLDYLKAFSLENIWLFFHPAQGYYRSLIYHFNGVAWQYIPSPQPYDLGSVVFIDSVSFYATGSYGNLIHYNGTKATNLSNPGGRNALIAASFSPSHLLIWTQEDNNATEHFYRLNEYYLGAWHSKDSLSMKSVISSSFFLSPDSGYFTSQDNCLYKYAKNQFSIIEKFPGRLSGPYDNGLLYYCDADIALFNYEIITGERKKMAQAPLECSVFPLRKNEFLLLGSDKNVYYLGDRNCGQAFKKARITFRLYNVSKAPSNNIGVASYRNKNNLIDLYFTNIYEKNNFSTFHFDYKQLDFELYDVFLQRGLIGLGIKKEPEDSLDHGCFFADIDNDEDMDAVMAPIRGPALLYENVGNDRFEDITDEMHFNLSGRLQSVWWSDLNSDGLLDIVAGDYLGPISILINRGHFRFKEVSRQAGISANLKNRLLALADVDNDGDQDLFLFNESEPIRYLENKGVQDSTWLPLFADVSFRSPQLTTRFDFFTQSMAFGDYDNDGDLDLFLANRQSPLKLFQNEGQGNFVDVSDETGFNQSVLAFGANWGDLDQDGYLDLFLTTLGRNCIFWNNKGKLFAMDSTSLPANDEGSSTGAILEDLDADGDLDIVVARSEILNSLIYRSKLDLQNFIKLQLKGTRSNRHGIGGRIWLYEAGHLNETRYLRGYRQITTNTGFCSSCLPEACFGVPDEAGKRYDAVAIFPDGERLEKYGLKPGQTKIIKEKVSLAYLLNKTLSDAKIFIYRERYRRTAVQLLFLLLFLSLANYYIHVHKNWPIIQRLMFNVAALFLFLLTFFASQLPGLTTIWFLQMPIILFSASFIFYLLQEFTVRQYQDEQLTELYDRTRQFNHSEEGMKQIVHLIFYLNNIQQVLSQAKMKQQFANELNSFSQFTLPNVRRLVNEGKRLGLPYDQMQQLEKTSKHLARSSSKVLANLSFLKQSYTPMSMNLKQLQRQVMLFKKKLEGFFVCDPLQVLSDCLLKFPQFTERSILKQSQNREQVIVGSSELAEVFTNLFRNALEAMAQQKEKRIQSSIELAVGGYLAIKIQDFGKGIPKGRHSIIFEESYSTKGSTGLGLFHARKLVRRYGGEVELVQSSPGKGSTFQIKLRIHEL